MEMLNENLSLNAEVLANLFQQEIPLVQDFLNLLEQENNLLQNFRSEGLDDLVAQKNKLLPQIQDLENQRINLLNLPEKSESTSNSITAATDNLIAQIDDPKISILWEILRELAKNVQGLNSQNGNLLGLHLNKTNEILKILQQQTDKPTLYGKQGRAYEESGGRISDKA
ncbi:MAG: flagella synthesis protein FlgN [Rhodocyclaceae bacterium]